MSTERTPSNPAGTASSPASATVAASIATYLATFGIRHTYGVPGEDHMGLLAALDTAGIRYVCARDESAACIMACAEIQRTGLPAVALVTLAPGLTNAINGIANAYLDNLPLVILCGQHPVSRSSSVIRQYLDSRVVVQGVTKAYLAATASINHDLQRAFATAMDAPAGPVLLEVRDEVARLEAADTIGDWSGAVTSGAQQWKPPVEVARQLASASRPVIVVGAELGGSTLHAVVAKLAGQLRAPVLVTPSANGRVATSDEWFAGTFLNGNLESAILAKADAVLGVDLRANEVFNRPWKYVPLLTISARANPERFYPTRHEVIGSSEQLLLALAQQLAEQRVESCWTPADVDAYRQEVQSHFTGDVTLTIPKAIEVIRSRMPEDTIVAIDAGFGKPLIAYLWRTDVWPGYFASNGLSTMGYAIPAANALQLNVSDDRRVVGFVGDGSLLMRAAEISVAAELHLPCIFIAWMDSALTQISVKQRRAGLREVGTRMPTYSCQLIGAAFGAAGCDVETVDELHIALDAALSRNAPTLIGVHIDQRRSDEWFDLLRG